ncbi:hypothetical protein OUZ56_024554 [Daphnia magna]|uniref:Uncharacterized protein n=1 Tax=Daphnia magna TaxID=35525 RepID=A0ABR0B0Y7_9CRUS|nr:hypothetical protein OUZ56_024554 [Daphnia magna]
MECASGGAVLCVVNVCYFYGKFCDLWAYSEREQLKCKYFKEHRGKKKQQIIFILVGHDIALWYPTYGKELMVQQKKENHDGDVIVEADGWWLAATRLLVELLGAIVG